jgi:hypothetical protein
MGKPLVFGRRGNSAFLHNIPIHRTVKKLRFLPSGDLARSASPQ